MNREEWINRLKEVQPMLFDGLRRMVAIPSIRGKEEPDAPFGRGPKQALEEVLKISCLSKYSGNPLSIKSSLNLFFEITTILSSDSTHNSYKIQ